MKTLTDLGRRVTRAATVTVAALAAILVAAGTTEAASLTLADAGLPTALTTDDLRGGMNFAVPNDPDQESILHITIANAQWTVPQDLRLYEDSAFTQLSDIVRFVNVGGMGQLYFKSDTEGVPLTEDGLPPLPSGAPIGRAQETAAPIALTLNTDRIPLLVRAFSDPNESERPGDTLTLQAVPEPSSLVLLSTGLLAPLGAWWLRHGRSRVAGEC